MLPFVTTGKARGPGGDEGRDNRGGADKKSRLNAAVPGIGMLRTYKPAWLRFDLVAGIVLAAILVPQGLAYAELAGLPPVTGLYTTIACLIVYALLGPSRVLVLGPDSSVSPLIFAAIMPLLVANDTASAIAMAGMLALMVGLIEIGLGLGKLGFIADLLSKEVQVGYMNGLAITIIVGQLPKLFGFSTDADSFVDEVGAFFSNLDQTNTTTLLVGLGTLALLLGLPRISKKIPAVLVAVVAATVVSAAFGLAAEGVKTVGTLPSGLPTPSFPWTERERPRDAGRRRRRHRAGLADRHHRHVLQLRRPARRRGGRRPRDDRGRRLQRRRRPVPGLRDLGQRLADGRRRAVRRQDAGDRARRRRPRRRSCSSSSRGCSRTSRRRRWPPWSIMAAISLADIAVLRRFAHVRKTALLLSLVATAGVVFFGVLRAS